MFAIRKSLFDNNIEFNTLLNTPDVNRTGYIVEVDLHVPVDLHDTFEEFSSALETLTLDIDLLTPYQREIGVNTGIMNNDVFFRASKLVPHISTINPT